MVKNFAKCYFFAKGQSLVETVLANGNYPTSGNYPDISKTERFHCIVSLGTIADALTFELKIADANDGTLDVIDATYAKKTILATDDGQLILFDVETKKLAQDHYFVSCVVSGVSGSNYAEIFFILPEHTKPVVQTASVLPDDNIKEYTGAYSA